MASLVDHGGAEHVPVLRHAGCRWPAPTGKGDRAVPVGARRGEEVVRSERRIERGPRVGRAIDARSERPLRHDGNPSVAGHRLPVPAGHDLGRLHRGRHLGGCGRGARRDPMAPLGGIGGSRHGKSREDCDGDDDAGSGHLQSMDAARPSGLIPHGCSRGGVRGEGEGRPDSPFWAGVPMG